MENLEHLRGSLEHYRQQRQQKLLELQRIESMIAQLEADLGEEASITEPISNTPGIPFTTAASPNTSGTFSTAGAVAIRPDEFYGLSQSEAAKTYLRKIGRAVPFEELVAALKKGGAKLGGKDPKRTLYVSLARNPKKEFVWPSDDHISLGEFYAK